MKNLRVKNILQTGEQGQKVKISAWVRSARVSKHVAFLAVNDGSSQGTFQLIVDASSPEYEKAKEVNTGASLEAVGTLQKSPKKETELELHVEELSILGNTTPSYPLQKKGHSLEFLREIAHLRGRTNTFGAVFRVRNCLAQGVHEFFRSKDFVWAHTPILTGTDCEGAGELFRVTNFDLEKIPKDEKGKVSYRDDFFGVPSYLTVSGQLQAEIMALSLGNTYTFGPTFRAENSNTARHLSEFWMVEPEMPFCDLEGNMDLAEEFISFLIQHTLKNCHEELRFFEKFYKSCSIAELESVSKAKFHRLSYTDAIKALQDSQKKFEYPVEWGLDLQTEHERYLTEVIFKGPVTVFDYPKDIKAFYMRANDDNKTVRAMDLLVPKVGELIGGSQREERFDALSKRMTELNVSKEALWWYLDLRRQGTATHSGFGLGFERLVMYITGMQNIRDVVISPRHPKTVSF